MKLHHLINPLTDNGNINPNEPFCIGGQWFKWSELTAEQKQAVVKRKMEVAGYGHGALKTTPAEEFWIGIAAMNNINLMEHSGRLSKDVMRDMIKRAKP